MLNSYKSSFPMLAASMGLFLHFVMFQSGASTPGGTLSLPVLTLLFISEFGFFVTAFGAVVGSMGLLKQGFKTVPVLIALCCILFAVGFFILGMGLWKMIA